MAVYPNICIDDPAIRIDNAIIRIDTAYVPVGYLRARVTKAVEIMTTSGGPLARMTQSGGPRGRAS